jgi:hypothetical protein
MGESLPEETRPKRLSTVLSVRLVMLYMVITSKRPDVESNHAATLLEAHCKDHEPIDPCKKENYR